PVDRVAVVALVEPEAQGDARGRLRARGWHAVQRLLDQQVVVTVGAGDGDAQGHPTAVHQQAALGARLATVGRIRPRLFPPRAAPWSWRRPSLDRPTGSTATRRIPAASAPRGARTPQPASTPGSGGGPNCWSRCRSPGARSSGSRCAARSRSRPSPGGHPPVGGGSPAGVAGAAVTAAECAPTARLACPSTEPPAPRSSDALRPSRPSPSVFTSQDAQPARLT